MTGAQMIEEYDAIVANDLYPIYAATTAAKLDALNIASKEAMDSLKFLVRGVSLVYTTGTTRYNLLNLSTPLLSVNKVVYNDVEYFRSDHPNDKGFAQMDRYLDVFFDVTNGDSITLDGYIAGMPIVNTTDAITDIPVEIHRAIVLMAVYETCVAQEDDPGQLQRLANMVIHAKSAVQKKSKAMGSVAWKF